MTVAAGIEIEIGTMDVAVIEDGQGRLVIAALDHRGVIWR